MSTGSSGKSQTVTTQQNSAPWAPTQPGLQQGITDLGTLYSQGKFNINPYPGQTVAGVAPATSQSWDQTTALAGNQGNGVGAAQNYNNAILGGDFSALSPMIDATKQGVNSGFEAAGRYGGGNYANAVSKGISSTIAGAQGAAADRASGLQTASYLPAQMLNQIGVQQQGQAQNQINADVSKYNQQQTAPIDAINAYMQALSGNWGGTSVGTQTQPYYTPSGLQTGLGAGLSVAGILASLYGNS